MAVAHFHYVLSLGATAALALALLRYGPTLLGPAAPPTRAPCSAPAGLHALLSFHGIHLTFTPMHFLGFGAQPRRVPDYPDSLGVYNAVSTYNSLLIYYYIVIILLYRQDARSALSPLNILSYC